VLLLHGFNAFEPP